MKKRMILTAAAGLAFALTGCDVDQTRETKLPDVDVDVDGGQLPAFDVDWADVDAGTTTRTFKVPKVVVVMEEVDMEVPYVDIDMPNEHEKSERTIVVEAEVEEEAHRLKIEKVYGSGDDLIVISRIEPTGQPLAEEKVRVSDRIVVNAPDLDVRHYIIGERPAGEWNNQYRFIDSMSEIGDRLQHGTLIYSS